MRKRVLVASSVHPPDDPRIREKLIRSLSTDFDITYATQAPGPTDTEGLEWIPLLGTRKERRRAVGAMLRNEPFDAAIIHDPELLPAGVKAARAGRTVVFDMHENVPAQMAARASIPAMLRPSAAFGARWYLRRAEKKLHITLAETGYGDLFVHGHPVFPNYPRLEGLPSPGRSPDGPIVYVGDVTEIRGAVTLVEAAGRMENRRPVMFVGRCAPELERTLSDVGSGHGVIVDIKGWLPNPEAMLLVRQSAVGVSPLHDIPNYRNSLPTKTLEYLALGVPVVASDMPGTRNVIGDLAGVSLVPPGDADALARTLDRILSDDLGANHLPDPAMVRSTFSWPEYEVIEYYLSLTS